MDAACKKVQGEKIHLAFDLMWVPVESLIYSVEVWETEYCFIFIYLIKLYSINTYCARHCSKSFTNITRLLQPEHKSHLEKNSKCYKQMSQTYLGKASEMRARGWDGGEWVSGRIKRQGIYVYL